MALLSPQLHGKRKRESNGCTGEFLKKLTPPEAFLTPLPPPAYSASRGGRQLNGLQQPQAKRAHKGAEFSIVLHPTSIAQPTHKESIVVAKSHSHNGGLAGLYRQVRYEAEFAHMRERLDLLNQQMAQMQAELRKPASQDAVKEKYAQTVRLNKEAADLHKAVASKEVMVSETETNKAMKEREETKGEEKLGKDAPRSPGAQTSLAGAQSKLIFERLHDLTLDDSRQRSRDLEIQVREAQLAVQKQQRLREEELVEEEEEVTEQEEDDEEEVTEEVTDEEVGESEEEFEEEGFVQIPLTEEEEDLVDEILDTPPSNDMVVSHKASSMDITKEQMQCLRKETWLNDEIINLYMILLKERESREDFQEEGDHPVCHFFNTFFYNKLRMDSGEYTYASVQRWTRRLKYKLVKCDKVIVPIHQGIHWALAVINLRDRQLEYFDSVCNGTSYPFSTKADPEMVLDDLAQYVMDESENKQTGSLDTSNWRRVYYRDLPQQLNGSDCGMFMVKFADFASRDAPINFTQKDMWYFRRKLVVELTHLRAE